MKKAGLRFDARRRRRGSTLLLCCVGVAALYGPRARGEAKPRSWIFQPRTRAVAAVAQILVLPPTCLDLSRRNIALCS